MKHAGPDGLQRLTELLNGLRTLPGLVERTPGCFYRRGQAFLHFHEDPAGLFADVKLPGPRFRRCEVNTSAQQQALLADVRAGLLPGG